MLVRADDLEIYLASVDERSLKIAERVASALEAEWLSGEDMLKLYTALFGAKEANGERVLLARVHGTYILARTRDVLGGTSARLARSSVRRLLEEVRGSWLVVKELYGPVRAGGIVAFATRETLADFAEQFENIRFVLVGTGKRGSISTVEAGRREIVLAARECAERGGCGTDEFLGRVALAAYRGDAGKRRDALRHNFDVLERLGYVYKCCRHVFAFSERPAARVDDIVLRALARAYSIYDEHSWSIVVARGIRKIIINYYNIRRALNRADDSFSGEPPAPPRVVINGVELDTRSINMIFVNEKTLIVEGVVVLLEPRASVHIESGGEDAWQDEARTLFSWLEWETGTEMRGITARRVTVNAGTAHITIEPAENTKHMRLIIREQHIVPLTPARIAVQDNAAREYVARGLAHGKNEIAWMLVRHGKIENYFVTIETEEDFKQYPGIVICRAYDAALEEQEGRLGERAEQALGRFLSVFAELVPLEDAPSTADEIVRHADSLRRVLA